MTYTTKTLSKNQLEMEITISQDRQKPYLEKTAQRFSREMKIAGFRPGKIPLEIVKQQVGEMKLLQESIQEILNDALKEILEKEKFKSIGMPQVDIKQIAPQNPLVFKVLFALRPEITLPNLKIIKIAKKESAAVEEKEIEEVLKNLQAMRAKESLKNEAAAKGDKVEINCEITRNGVLIENGKMQKHPIVLGQGKMIPGFEEALIGLKAGEDKKFKLKFPEKYYDKNLQGAEAGFKANVLSVFKRELPEINDEFAKTLNPKFKNLADYKKELEKSIKQEREAQETQKQEIEMLENILEKTKFSDIPDMLIHQQEQKMLEEMKSDLEARGGKWQDYLSHLKQTEEQIKSSLTGQAEKKVKISLVLNKIAQEQKIKVNDQEAEEELAKMLKLYPQNQQAQNPQYREYLRNVLLNRKVIMYLKNKILNPKS